MRFCKKKKTAERTHTESMIQTVHHETIAKSSPGPVKTTRLNQSKHH
jgi:hypothetical protein